MMYVRMKNHWKKCKPKATFRMKIASGIFDTDDNLVFTLTNRTKSRFNMLRKAFKLSNLESNAQNFLTTLNRSQGYNK